MKFYLATFGEEPLADFVRARYVDTQWNIEPDLANRYSEPHQALFFCVPLSTETGGFWASQPNPQSPVVGFDARADTWTLERK